MEATRFLPLLGRILIGLPFLVSASQARMPSDQRQPTSAAVGLPLAPLGWVIADCFEVGGGVV